MSAPIAPRGKRPYRMVARAAAAQKTRDRVAECAWRHFSERPYDSVRLAAVAADAGVSVQTLHAIHGTKDELFVAAWVWFAGKQVSGRDEAPVGDVMTAVRLLSTATSRTVTPRAG